MQSDKVTMGAERRSMVMTEDEKLIHIMKGDMRWCLLNMPSYDPIHKATIIPRGRALGMVMNLPERDNMVIPMKSDLKARLAVCFGGRVAEEVILVKIIYQQVQVEVVDLT